MRSRAIPVPSAACHEASASQRAFFCPRPRAERLSFFAWCQDPPQRGMKGCFLGPRREFLSARSRRPTSSSGVGRSIGLTPLTPLSALQRRGLAGATRRRGGRSIRREGGGPAAPLPPRRLLPPPPPPPPGPPRRGGAAGGGGGGDYGGGGGRLAPPLPSEKTLPPPPAKTR